MHLIRRVSERGIKKTLTPEDRPLKVLLMACSPQNVSQVLEFEKEEDTILEVTQERLTYVAELSEITAERQRISINIFYITIYSLCY